jgi:hypothetical protein
MINHRVRTRMGRWLAGAMVLVLAWGALSFGAVYPWAYWPLTIACAAIGLLSLTITPPHTRQSWRLPAVLAAIVVFVALQVVPIAGPRLARWSPARGAFLKQFDVLYSLSGGTTPHAMSINPHATTVALAVLVAFSLLLVGATRLLSVVGAKGFVKGIVGFGLLLALIAIVQNMAFAAQAGEGRTVYIYGFWPDPYANKPFGPFINKNNFAGWMIMAMPLALGYAVSVAAGSLSGVYPDWRSRVLWLSSRQAARAILAALAAFGMGIALVMSMSRSGMVACAVAIVAAAWCVPARPRAWRARLAPVGASLLLLGGLSVWVGTDVIAQRFVDGTDATMMGRFGAWKDAMSIISDFPVVGTGVNAFSTAMVVYQRSDPNNFWEEAHNDYLQIVAEGGLILSALVLIAIVVIVVDIRARFTEDGTSPARWLRVGAVTGLGAIALQEIVEFSLQIPGNAVLFVALLAIARHRPPARDRA